MLTLNWHGPIKLLPAKDEHWVICEPEAWHKGIYLWTFPIDGSYRINYVGIAPVITIAERLSKHIYEFLAGHYLYYFSDDLRKGEMKRAYHPKEDEPEVHIAHLEELRVQLNLMEIFFTPLAEDTDMLKRIESGIINHLRNGTNGVEDWIDNEILSRSRKEDDIPIELKCISKVKLDGFEDAFSV